MPRIQRSHLPRLVFADLPGQNRAGYESPDQRHELRSLPDRKFSGLHLMCLMYAGFKRVAPEHEVQMDLNDPFPTALQMHKNGRGQTMTLHCQLN
ncbi:MAG TPA: hypothetical protein VN887_04610 [Candidatus Angelobacter sp.]|nr:hypothetical protein [Candidatus Angelobacter sp.]